MNYTKSKPPVTLRELNKSDLPKLNEWRNNKKLLDLLGNNFLFISGDVDEKWFEDYLKNRDKAIRLAIIASETDDYIGNVNLTSIHAINRSAEFSILIGNEAYWTKGLGTFCTLAMLNHGFKDRGLHRIYLTVLQENTRAIEMYKKAGFRIEGVKRQDIYKNGAFYDVVMMAMLENEFKTT